MNLDLTGLAEAGHPAGGEPLMLPLGTIDRDANQPRKVFDEEALEELAASIRAIGVVQPISVRPDAAVRGRYIINYGERRYRAALIAGLNAIPVFVHRTPDSYTQVAENLHHAELSPMEMALFIKARLDVGEKKADIAARLGYKKSYVTEHLALLESPGCVEKAYASGISSARTLYDLRRLHDEFPKQVDAWCAGGAEVTRESIAALANRVRHDEQPDEASGALRENMPRSNQDVSNSIDSQVGRIALGDDMVEKVRHDEQAAALSKNLDRSDDVSIKLASADTNDALGGRHSPRSGKRQRHNSTSYPHAVKLRIEVRHDGRRAIVQEDSVLHIRYEDGGTAEVRLADAIVVAAVSA